MVFNPIFIQNMTSGSSINAPKTNKFGNSSYLFADIINVKLDEAISKETKAQKNGNESHLSLSASQLPDELSAIMRDVDITDEGMEIKSSVGFNSVIDYLKDNKELSVQIISDGNSDQHNAAKPFDKNILEDELKKNGKVSLSVISEGKEYKIEIRVSEKTEVAGNVQDKSRKLDSFVSGKFSEIKKVLKDITQFGKTIPKEDVAEKINDLTYLVEHSTEMSVEQKENLKSLIGGLKEVLGSYSISNSEQTEQIVNDQPNELNTDSLKIVKKDFSELKSLLNELVDSISKSDKKVESFELDKISTGINILLSNMENIIHDKEEIKNNLQILVDKLDELQNASSDEELDTEIKGILSNIVENLKNDEEDSKKLDGLLVAISAFLLNTPVAEKNDEVKELFTNSYKLSGEELDTISSAKELISFVKEIKGKDNIISYDNSDLMKLKEKVVAIAAALSEPEKKELLAELNELGNTEKKNPNNLLKALITEVNNKATNIEDPETQKVLASVSRLLKNISDEQKPLVPGRENIVKLSDNIKIGKSDLAKVISVIKEEVLSEKSDTGVISEVKESANSSQIENPIPMNATSKKSFNVKSNFENNVDKNITPKLSGDKNISNLSTAIEVSDEAESGKRIIQKSVPEVTENSNVDKISVKNEVQAFSEEVIIEKDSKPATNGKEIVKPEIKVEEKNSTKQNVVDSEKVKSIYKIAVQLKEIEKIIEKLEPTPTDEKQGKFQIKITAGNGEAPSTLEEIQKISLGSGKPALDELMMNTNPNTKTSDIIKEKKGSNSKAEAYKKYFLSDSGKIINEVKNVVENNAKLDTNSNSNVKPDPNIFKEYAPNGESITAEKNLDIQSESGKILTQSFTKNESQEAQSTVSNNHTIRPEAIGKFENRFSMRNIPQQLKIVDVKNLHKEFTQIIKSGDRSSVKMLLSPEELGKLDVKLELVKNVLKASIEVESEAAKQAVNDNLEMLKQSLQQSGVQVNSLNVSLNYTNEGKQNRFVKPKKKDNEQMGEQVEFNADNEEEKSYKNMGYNTYDYIV